MELWFTEKEFDYKNVGLTIKIKRQLHSVDTPYQRLDIFETQYYGRMMTLDGIIQLTERDEFFYHEMIAHVPMFMLKAPKRVLVVGGGDGGTAREALKHPTVERVDMAEIDEQVIVAARQWFPACAVAFDDPRLDLQVVDAIKFVADAPPETYDAILIDSSDPVGPAVGLFTKEFYQNCHRILKPSGVVVAQSGSFWYQPNESRMVCLTLREVFGNDRAHIYWSYTPTYPSGAMAYTLAAKGFDPLDFAAARKPDGSTFADLKYYTPTIHQGAFGIPKFVSDALAPTE